MEAKFTPGPWMMSGQQKVSNGKRLIAITQGRLEVNNGLDENMANANLIASAPDLYFALQQAATSMQDNGYSNHHLAVIAAKKALAKARGELVTEAGPIPIDQIKSELTTGTVSLENYLRHNFDIYRKVK